MRNAIPILLLLLFSMTTASCASKLKTTSISYQSIRTTFTQPKEMPEGAEIWVQYSIDDEGVIHPVVLNCTDEIMIIDQTKSFFVNSTGTSISYYDPTVRTTTVTDLSQGSKGASVNLGAIGGALGIGGVVGDILGGVNVGGSSTSGQSVANSTYTMDTPQVSLAPHGSLAMSKEFKVIGIGKDPLSTTFLERNENQSDVRFSVCISYSLDKGETFKKIVTDFFVNSRIIENVTNSKTINSTLSSIFRQKTDAIYEPWWMLYFKNNADFAHDTYISGRLYDYQ